MAYDIGFWDLMITKSDFVAKIQFLSTQLNCFENILMAVLFKEIQPSIFFKTFKPMLTLVCGLVVHNNHGLQDRF